MICHLFKPRDAESLYLLRRNHAYDNQCVKAAGFYRISSCIILCFSWIDDGADSTTRHSISDPSGGPAVKARNHNLAGYTVTEHYAVYRGNDEIHPVAEMTVITTYKMESGKSYTIVSQSGSGIVRDLVLDEILDNEKHLNQPGIREGAWITSANYHMKLKPGGTQTLDGRECLVLTLIPKRKAPYLIEGSLWVDLRDGSIVQVQGTTSQVRRC